MVLSSYLCIVSLIIAISVSVILHMFNLSQSSGVTILSVWINEFSKVSGYKISTEKFLSFLYTKNEKSETEIK